MNEKLTFVLGASDPEMNVIERLVRDLGYHVVYAMYGATRVHPGTAYQADSTDPEPRPRTPVIAVECGGRAINKLNVIARADHHRPGDYGYGLGPDQFLPASSIGQVISLLVKDGRLHDLPGWSRSHFVRDSDTTPGEFRAVSYSRGRGKRSACEWGVAITSQYGDIDWLFVPSHIVYVAAADHCLAAAYRGECHGVLPDKLMEIRIAQRAAFQGRSRSAVERDVREARKALARAPWVSLDPHGRPKYICLECGGVVESAHMDGYSHVCACDTPRTPPAAVDMRPGKGAPCGEHGPECSGELPDCWGDIPELPEAACREGVPFIAIPRFRDRRKLVLQSAPADAVSALLNGAFDLEDTYGDPERGFAGGYLAR